MNFTMQLQQYAHEVYEYTIGPPYPFSYPVVKAFLICVVGAIQVVCLLLFVFLFFLGMLLSLCMYF